MQPQVGVEITAHSVTDPDGRSGTRDNDDIEESDATWQWYRSTSKTATGTMIAGAGGTAAEYTPDAADVGNYLRVVATYADGRGSGKTAAAVSEYTTISAITNNTVPAFSATSTTRVVLEGADKGTSIGNPVTATDDNSGERLTYWLSGTDANRFSIDAMTGQLKVNIKLDYEGTMVSDDIDQCTVTNACEVTVNAADSSGTVTEPTIDVTINVIAVDEKPTITGPTRIVIKEDMTALWDDTNAETDVTYTASDPEGGSVTLSLSGSDASKFELNDPAEVAPGSKVLAFKAKPDFEMPGDSNRDNVYQVTVVASDGANPAMRDVIVKVTDMMEAGEIEVMPSQPRVGTALTATLTDSDGVMDPTWKWRRAMVAETCPDETSELWNPDTTLIDDAESATYTPVSDDDGYCLRVEASYLDMDYSEEDMFAKSVPYVLGGKVQGSSTNMAPVFADTRAMRYVPENSDEAVNVGAPVEAKDTDTLEYTLGGADKDLFTIVQADDDDADEEEGQIRVKAGAMLDHETKPTLTVRVTATDPHQATDTITVTINVTDVDEMPVISQVNPDNRVPVFSSSTTSRSVAENTLAGRSIGAPVTATDPDNDSLNYTLSGADSSSFGIGRTSGQLMTRAALDYETKNSYTVTVMARDPSGGSDTITVTIAVTDVVNEEAPPADSVLAEYDADNSGRIERSEVLTAIGDLVFGRANIQRDDVLSIIGAFAFQRPVDGT